MICRQCGTEYPNEGRFCPGCGAPNRPEAPAEAPRPQTYQPAYAPQPERCSDSSMTAEAFFSRNPQYRPMTAWSYFGHSLLYSIPIVGFIFLIIHSCNSGYIARRNYARSFWCALIVAAIVLAICLVICLVTGVSLWGMIEQMS